MTDAPILTARAITKKFPGVVALRDVSFDLRPGEIHALCGENGAGKSTLIKILSGFHKPDSGTYSFEGKPVNLNSPIEARALGIQTVYQDLALVNDLSVYHNMFLGRERKKRILGIPAERTARSVVLIGYPTSTKDPRPTRAEPGRKPLSALVSYDRWGGSKA